MLPVHQHESQVHVYDGCVVVLKQVDDQSLEIYQRLFFHCLNVLVQEGLCSQHSYSTTVTCANEDTHGVKRDRQCNDCTRSLSFPLDTVLHFR